MDLEESKEVLRKHIINHGLTFGYYTPTDRARILYDTREALLGEHLGIAGRLIWDKIKKYNPTYLIGSGFASFMLMSSVKVIAESENYNLKILLNRGERKKTNRKRLIEGPRPAPNDTAIYIDDLMNSGGTWAKTKSALIEEKINIPIIAACVLIDFWTYRGSRRLEILGIPVERVFYRHDLGDTRQDPKESPLTKELAWRSLAHNQWIQWYKAPPYIFNDKVYYANDRHEIYCHDINSGEIIWKYQGPHPTMEKGIGCMLQIVNGILYSSSYDGSLTAFNALTGEVKWKKHIDMFLHGTPWIDETRQEIYIGTEGGIQNKRGDIVCLDLETGRTKWIFPTQHVVPCSPRLIGNNVICGSNDGYLYSLDVNTGNLIFSIQTGEVKGRVNYIDDIIVACSLDGKIYGISQEGEILWTRNCGTSSNHQFLPVHRKSGLVFVGNSDGMLLAYDKHGNQIWLRNLRDDVGWNITLKGDELLVVTSNSSHLYQIDPLTGKKLKYEKLLYITRAPCDFNEEYIVINASARGLHVYRRNND